MLNFKHGLMLSVVLVLTACQSAPSTKLSYGQCYFPDEPTVAAPQWVCHVPVEGLMLQGVGFAPSMSSGMSMMIDTATLDARSQIANNFSSFVHARMQQVISDQTIDGESVGISNAKRIQQSVTAMQLQHSRVYQTAASPTGGVFVLVGLDAEHYQVNLERLIAEAELTDDPALYQRFLMEEANRELDAIRERVES